MKVGIRDIAERAGVSVATVSNALNGRQGVSREISEKIVRIAEELGYRKTKKTETKAHIRLVMFKRHGLVVGDTQFFAELTEGIEQGCQEEKAELVISQIQKGKDPDYIEKIERICADECQGVLLLSTELEKEDLGLFRQCRSPLLIVDNLFRHERVHCVVMNNYDAGYQATEALIAQGHREIGHITSSTEFNNMRYRRKGFEAAMRAAGLPVQEEFCWKVRPTIDGAYQDARRLLEQRVKLPTAFFAGNDIMAVGCMRAFQEAGVRMPEELSVIGMDDTFLCQASTPPLSTIRVHRREMGRIAVNLLLHTVPLAHSSVVKTELGVDLIERGSVAAPCR